MGNVERCDKTLPTNEMMFALRRDPALRARLVEDLDAVARQFGLSRDEVEAIRAKDPRRLMDLGVHQYLLKQGDHAALLRECTLERMEEAGSGGTAELLAWILVLAFTRGPADVLAYMRAFAWRSGTGMVAWSDLA